ncbi:alpha-N-acetylgalactosaminide alpha-2,6-sialyltransferase 3 isoform X3 [Mus musculus]|uniref:alpha-N-acetylgalactosaminide alpha-2,6-sialyltransferase 3 isoform X3 n=1 Tax=Mus musculus TaxID=10090 RepID=UPI0003D75F67|nr:alpha-N-acetylgalactosaminide alpha-2,6-sialyltransferase 3 isoform X3 [Mus musculus]|eukprot:XP_006501284.1 PREDICTED: alpha-N-acetylgalactosaminide alpha-2,6-sialyltransferase 3 isoform X3 [Mus musculus]
MEMSELRFSTEQEHAKRKPVLVVSFIALCILLLAMRLVNDATFPLLLNCFGQPKTKWIPLPYTFRQPLRTHYGYINVRTQEPLQLNCNHCAIVSNSGQMVGQKVGEEIDHASCIWRMNNAPTKGFEEDVGYMTMVRVVSHTSVPLLLKNPDYFFKEASRTIYVIWGPFRNMRKDGNGIVYNMLKKTVDAYPDAQIYVTTEQQMTHCDRVFKDETGKDSFSVPTSHLEAHKGCSHNSHLRLQTSVCCRNQKTSIPQSKSPVWLLPQHWLVYLYPGYGCLLQYPRLRDDK